MRPRMHRHLCRLRVRQHRQVYLPFACLQRALPRVQQNYQLNRHQAVRPNGLQFQMLCVLLCFSRFVERMVEVIRMIVKPRGSMSRLLILENAKILRANAPQGAYVLLKDLLAQRAPRHAVVRHMILSLVVAWTEAGCVLSTKHACSVMNFRPTCQLLCLRKFRRNF